MLNQNNMISTFLTKNKALILLCFISLLFLPFFTHAQSDSVSLSVSPTIIEMSATPGQVWESNLRIINSNSFELTVYAEVVDFRPLGEEGNSTFIPPDVSDDKKTTLAEWVVVPETALVIGPERTLEIPLKVELPEDAMPGGHYAAVLVGTRPTSDRKDQSRVEISQVVSSLLFLRAAGDIVEDASIRSFRPLKSLVETPKVDFEMRLENKGNVHIRPEGEIKIFNMWGQERGSIPVNRKTLFGNVLADSIRSFKFTWEGEWSPADIGRYTAEATLAYGEEGRQTTWSETSFWILPWRALLGIILVLVVSVTLITWFVRLYIRRMLAIAGIEKKPSSYPEIVTTKKPLSITAPIEAGILDLRSRLSNSDSGRMNTILNFISEYRIFFTGFLVFIIIAYIISLFVGSVSEDDRAFEVTVNRAGEEVVMDSESLQYEPQQSSDDAIKRDVPPLVLVNRSGVNGGAATVALALEELGYTIDSVSADLNQTEEKTVVVYDPSLAEDALELSAILDNALLSAFDDSNADDQIITIYIGSDIVE